jgi:hypothetical protein
VHLFCSVLSSPPILKISDLCHLIYSDWPETISVHRTRFQYYIFMWSYFLKIVSRYIGDDFFFGSNLVSFNRTLVVPYEISKVNFHVNKILVSILVCPFFVDLSIIVEITIKLTNLIKYGIAYL